MQPQVRATPDVLYLEVTNRCNSRCTTCVRTYDLAEPERDVGLPEVERLIAGFEPGGAPRRVVLNGVGEALLHPEIVSIVRSFARTGAAVLFNTNAVTLTGTLAVALGRAGLAELRVSIDGATRATYRSLRGIDALHRVCANVRAAVSALREAVLERPRISVWLTGNRENLRELPAMVLLVRDLGVGELYFQRLVFRDAASGFGAARAERSLARGTLGEADERAFEDARRLALELGVTLRGSGDASDAKRALPERAEDERPWAACRRPYESTYVTANGNLLPCCIAPFSTPDYASITMGDLAETSLSDVWNGARYAEFRRRFESGDPPECCRRCGTDWAL